jgi:hypothetical protein
MLAMIWMLVVLVVGFVLFPYVTPFVLVRGKRP